MGRVPLALLGLPYSDVLLDSEGLRLSAWYVLASKPGRPVVVLCHGLGANKQNFLPVAQTLHELDFNVVTFDFRGHGDSEGRTTTFGIKESRDVVAAFGWARGKTSFEQGVRRGLLDGRCSVGADGC